MTYEYAAYFKLLLLCGYKDELQQYVDHALNEQDPIPDIVLELYTVGMDDKKILSVLNEYLRQVSADQIDYNKTVFDLVMAFLKRKHDESMPMKDLTDLMYRLAVHTERYNEEPWETMYYLGNSFCEAEDGFLDIEDYKHRLALFINEKRCLWVYPPVQPKESFFKRILKRIKWR